MDIKVHVYRTDKAYLFTYIYYCITYYSLILQFFIHYHSLRPILAIKVYLAILKD